MNINFPNHSNVITEFSPLNFFYCLLIILTSCKKEKSENIQIIDCNAQYKEITKDSSKTKWNKTNAQILVANCLYEKYFEKKDLKYKNEVIKLSKIINKNIEIYHDTIKESNFEYINENNIWKPKNPYKFYVQAVE